MTRIVQSIILVFYFIWCSHNAARYFGLIHILYYSRTWNKKNLFVWESAHLWMKKRKDVSTPSARLDIRQLMWIWQYLPRLISIKVSRQYLDCHNVQKKLRNITAAKPPDVVEETTYQCNEIYFWPDMWVWGLRQWWAEQTRHDCKGQANKKHAIYNPWKMKIKILKNLKILNQTCRWQNVCIHTFQDKPNSIWLWFINTLHEVHWTCL